MVSSLLATLLGVSLFITRASAECSILKVWGGSGTPTTGFAIDAKGTKWTPMITTLNVPGNFGLREATRAHFTVVVNFDEFDDAADGCCHQQGGSDDAE
uniref:Putative secreted protein n=1 Tax=Hemileia vastatrix TaxID=203904 RepID=T1UQ51_9BASI|nr:putative secreted protein [Hemileia vastatrix]